MLTAATSFPSATREVWDMSMWNANDSTEVYNTATVILGRHDNDNRHSNEPIVYGRVDPVDTKNDGVTTDIWYNVYRDEWDLYTPHVPLRTALNLFERSRTNFLGGPNLLRQLQVEHDLLFVVTTIDPCTVVAKTPAFTTTATMINGEHAPSSLLPTSLLVRTTFVPKRRGRIVECHHSLLAPLPHDNGHSDTTDRYQRLVHGVVTMLALQGSTRRPATKKFPDWL
jgi:hypothetical protein